VNCNIYFGAARPSPAAGRPAAHGPLLAKWPGVCYEQRYWRKAKDGGSTRHHAGRQREYRTGHRPCGPPTAGGGFAFAQERAMAVTITEVHDASGLRKWVSFPFDHYRNDPCYIPQLVREELDFFRSDRNPSFKIADTRMLLARKNGQVAGRVFGLIHQLESQKLGYRRGRFGWFECVDDAAVAEALLTDLQGWFESRGCREMTGPHGFTDLDPEGLLIEGFEELPTLAGSYNKPYYRRMLEGFGFEKEVDYIETRLEFPLEKPALFTLMEKKVLPAAAAEGYRVVAGLTKKGMLGYAAQFWEVLEASFAHLYGVTPLTDEQKAYYTKKYFGFIDPRFVQLVVDGAGRLQGFFLGLPSLSRPFQKAKGRLLPFGFFHLLRGFKRFDTVDFYFAGVHPQAAPKKILPLMILGMWHALKASQVKYLETNRELETNTMIVNLWSRFAVVNRRRSRIFRKSLPPAA
jgi:hypothetical protein